MGSVGSVGVGVGASVGSVGSAEILSVIHSADAHSVSGLNVIFTAVVSASI